MNKQANTVPPVDEVGADSAASNRFFAAPAFLARRHKPAMPPTVKNINVAMISKRFAKNVSPPSGLIKPHHPANFPVINHREWNGMEQ